MTDWGDINWPALEKLRASFLSGAPGGLDYWQDETQLASYDATFAQRIGWKWDYVLAELTRRGWTPQGGDSLDWGCGSGIASRAFLDHFGTDSVSKLHLWDRSPLAMSFAMKRAREKYPGLEVITGSFPETLPPHPDPLPRGEGTAIVCSPLSINQLATAGVPTQRRKTKSGADASPSPGGEGRGEGGPRNTILLISHVLTELAPEQIEALVRFAANATSVLWVEPGTYDASLTLIAIREKLRERFNVIAPCTHQTRCGILAPDNERHWCHHFASPPPGVFTDGNWSRFANMLGIDLRDLPLSFLVLDKRSAPALPPGATRIVGHPRIYKPHALLLGCDENGVNERRLTKRALPDEFKRLKKGGCDPLQIWKCEGEEIVSAVPLPEVRGGRP